MSAASWPATCPSCGIAHSGECWFRSRVDAPPSLRVEPAEGRLPMGCICPPGANLECQNQLCPRKPHAVFQVGAVEDPGVKA
jgi:hypothetical protein